MNTLGCYCKWDRRKFSYKWRLVFLPLPTINIFFIQRCKKSWMLKKSLSVPHGWRTMGEIQPPIKHIGVSGVSSSLGYYFRPVVFSLHPDYCCRVGVMLAWWPPWCHSAAPTAAGRDAPGTPRASCPRYLHPAKCPPVSWTSLTQELLNITWKFKQMEGKSCFLQPPCALHHEDPLPPSLPAHFLEHSLRSRCRQTKMFSQILLFPASNTSLNVNGALSVPLFYLFPSHSV